MRLRKSSIRVIKHITLIETGRLGTRTESFIEKRRKASLAPSAGAFSLRSVWTSIISTRPPKNYASLKCLDFTGMQSRQKLISASLFVPIATG